jgi:GNAT superfamily N-acetyltransferase
LDLLKECTLQRLPENFNLDVFECLNGDLNDFLRNDARNYGSQLLGVTYIFIIDAQPEKVACFFTVSNDALQVSIHSNNTKKRVQKHIPHVKQMRNYPAVKIGRLGVDKSLRGNQIGDQLMDFIKGWFIDNNKTGCRFLLVDAYNEPKVLEYYVRNGFEYLLRMEDEIKKDEKGNDLPLRTRIMFYDLIQLVGN